MTTDELLAKLDAEDAELESRLPDLYCHYGRCLYSYPNADPTQKYEIRNILDRKEEIRVFRNELKKEVGRVTE